MAGLGGRPFAPAPVKSGDPMKILHALAALFASAVVAGAAYMQ